MNALAVVTGEQGLEFFVFDKSYVEKLRAGDAHIEVHFVNYFSELIRLKLRSRLSSKEAMEDVRQETFVRVLTLLRGEGGLRQPIDWEPSSIRFATMSCSSTIVRKKEPRRPSTTKWQPALLAANQVRCVCWKPRTPSEWFARFLTGCPNATGVCFSRCCWKNATKMRFVPSSASPANI